MYHKTCRLGQLYVSVTANLSVFEEYLYEIIEKMKEAFKMPTKVKVKVEVLNYR